MNKNYLCLLLVLILFPVSAIAETLYVTDVLKLKLRDKASNEANVVTNLSSGDQLTLVEKQKRYTKVKTKEGKVGWVQSWFLTDKIPATFKLESLSKEKQQLAKQLAKTESKLNNFDSETAQENAQLKQSVSSLSNKINRLASAQNELEIKLEAQASDLAKYKFAERYNLNVIIAAFFMLSFAVGYIVSNIRMQLQERKRLRGYQLAH